MSATLTTTSAPTSITLLAVLAHRPATVRDELDRDKRDHAADQQAAMPFARGARLTPYRAEAPGLGIDHDSSPFIGAKC